MIKFYTDKSFLTEEHRKRIFPLLFDLCFLKDRSLTEYYMLVDEVIECDIAIFPIDYSEFLSYKPQFLRLQKDAQQHNKPIWVYSGGDFGFTNYIKNSTTYRLGGFDKILPEATQILPSFINDPYATFLQKEIIYLKKAKYPTVGFVGHAQSGTIKYLKEYFGYLKYRVKVTFGILKADKQKFYPSSIKRFKYLNKLQQNPKIETNFVLRQKYRAGVQTKVDLDRTTEEFYKNVYNNLYTFCIRGVGNFSVRFYETLAVGRIPVLINTDCRLPLSDHIDWQKHCLIINEIETNSLGQKLYEFHNSKSEEELLKIQKRNRDLWQNYLTRTAYFKKIHNIFTS